MFITIIIIIIIIHVYYYYLLLCNQFILKSKYFFMCLQTVQHICHVESDWVSPTGAYFLIN